MSIESTASPAFTCALGQTASLADLAEIHRRSVIRHSRTLSAEGSAEEKIISYFRELRDFLIANNFSGCPFSNAFINTRSSDSGIAAQVLAHKAYIRQFLIKLATQVTGDEGSIAFGEHLFLLYSGATIESQNSRSPWPVDRAIASVSDLLLAQSPSAASTAA